MPASASRSRCCCRETAICAVSGRERMRQAEPLGDPGRDRDRVVGAGRDHAVDLLGPREPLDRRLVLDRDDRAPVGVAKAGRGRVAVGGDDGQARPRGRPRARRAAPGRLRGRANGPFRPLSRRGQTTAARSGLGSADSQVRESSAAARARRRAARGRRRSRTCSATAAASHAWRPPRDDAPPTRRRPWASRSRAQAPCDASSYASSIAWTTSEPSTGRLQLGAGREPSRCSGTPPTTSATRTSSRSTGLASSTVYQRHDRLLVGRRQRHARRSSRSRRAPRRRRCRASVATASCS